MRVSSTSLWCTKILSLGCLDESLGAYLPFSERPRMPLDAHGAKSRPRFFGGSAPESFKTSLRVSRILSLGCLGESLGVHLPFSERPTMALDAHGAKSRLRVFGGGAPERFKTKLRDARILSLSYPEESLGAHLPLSERPRMAMEAHGAKSRSRIFGGSVPEGFQKSWRDAKILSLGCLEESLRAFLSF